MKIKDLKNLNINIINVFQSGKVTIEKEEAPGDASGAHGQAARQPRTVDARHRVCAGRAAGFGRPQIRK